jgi:hypothetical protein
MGNSKGRMLANPRKCRIGAVAHFTRHNLLRLILLKVEKRKRMNLDAPRSFVVLDGEVGKEKRTRSIFSIRYRL